MYLCKHQRQSVGMEHLAGVFSFEPVHLCQQIVDLVLSCTPQPTYQPVEHFFDNCNI